MTESGAALIKLIDCYLRGGLDPFISLQEVHKLLYLLHGAGEPLNIEFTRADNGPCVIDIYAVLQGMVDVSMISYFADAPSEAVSVPEASLILEQHPETAARTERVAQLIHGFESAFGLELLTSVLYAGGGDVASTIYSWGERQKMFSRRQIFLAEDVLVKNKFIVYSCILRYSEVGNNVQESRPCGVSAQPL